MSFPTTTTAATTRHWNLRQWIGEKRLQVKFITLSAKITQNSNLVVIKHNNICDRNDDARVLSMSRRCWTLNGDDDVDGRMSTDNIIPWYPCMQTYRSLEYFPNWQWVLPESPLR